MSFRTPYRTTALLSLAGLTAFAGGHAEGAAQTVAKSEPERLSLSAAIEEARRSAFHAGTSGSQHRNGQVAGIVGTAADYARASVRQEEHRVGGAIIARTLVLAELSHLAAVYLFYGCAVGDHGAAGCLLGPLLPLPAVALPAAVSGVDINTALGASAIGWLAGGAAFWLIGLAAGADSDEALLGLSLVSGLVHGGIMTAIIR